MQALVLIYINLSIHYATKSNRIEIICYSECLFVVIFFYFLHSPFFEQEAGYEMSLAGWVSQLHTKHLL